MSDEKLPATADKATALAVARFGVEDKALLAVLAVNPYNLATGKIALTPDGVLAVEKLDSRRLIRWLSLFPTPREWVRKRPGPGANCGGYRGRCDKCPNLKDCRSYLDYVDAGFVEQVLHFYFPGRWGLEQVKVFLQDAQWQAEGYFWVEHSDGRKQQVFACGNCDAKKKRDGSPLSPGFDRKGAVSDLIKKGASMMLGIAFDIYNRRDPSLPDLPQEAQAQEQKDKAEKSMRTLLREVSGVYELLHSDIPEVPAEYSPEAFWADAVKQFPTELAGCPPADTTDRDQVLKTVLEKLPEADLRALYGRLRSKYLTVNSEWRKSMRQKVDEVQAERRRKEEAAKQKDEAPPFGHGLGHLKSMPQDVAGKLLDELRSTFPQRGDSALEATLRMMARGEFKREWWELSTSQMSLCIRRLKEAK